MIKLKFYFIFIFFSLSQAQIINFIDPNFKAKLLSNAIDYVAFTGWNANIYSLNGITAVRVDTNYDNEIQISEAQVITQLNLDNAGITNLSGIEYFTSLKRLDYFYNNVSTLSSLGLNNLEVLGCQGNNLNSITFVSNFPNLKKLYCGSNLFSVLNINWPNNLITVSCALGNLTSINLTNLPQLRFLYCGYNQITALDFSNNTNLEKVSCEKNLLQSLDFRSNTFFNDLACSQNPNLASIYLKNGALQLFDNAPPPSAFDGWAGNPSLNYICADANEIGSIQTQIAPYYNLNNITFTSNCTLNTSAFEQILFEVYPNPSNGIFTIKFHEEIVGNISIEIYNLQGQKVHSETNINTIEQILFLNKFSKGVYILKIKNDSKTHSKRIIIK